jgi:hypothetical protein
MMMVCTGAVNFVLYVSIYLELEDLGLGRGMEPLGSQPRGT